MQLEKKRTLKKFIATIFSNEQCLVESVDYVFCNDAYLLNINKQFLNHDDLTDIITFNLAEYGMPVQGDIYISIERIRENALFLNLPVDKELHRVMFHGVLHLCGYKDKSKKDKLLMREMEDYYLNLYAVL